MRRIYWGVVNLILVGLLTLLASWMIINRQAVLDWYKLLSYTPPAEIAALADRTTMHGRGEDMFYVSEPEVSSAELFNATCTNDAEHSIVLGCYVARKIYIYNVTDKRLDGVKEVTAAHEMLHAAYDRLNPATRDHINDLLRAEMKRLEGDPYLLDLIKTYSKTQGSHLMNEMHSIIGTEYDGLAGELEDYYKQYFADRGQVVKLAESYKKIFNESKVRINKLKKELDSTHKQIQTNNARLGQMQSNLASEEARMRQLRHSDVDAYNAAVPGYNQMVREFNALVNQTKNLVDHYNRLVVKYNNEVAAQNDLYHSIDSKYEQA